MDAQNHETDTYRTRYLTPSRLELGKKFILDAPLINHERQLVPSFEIFKGYQFFDNVVVKLFILPEQDQIIYDFELFPAIFQHNAINYRLQYDFSIINTLEILENKVTLAVKVPPKILIGTQTVGYDQFWREADEDDLLVTKLKEAAVSKTHVIMFENPAEDVDLYFSVIYSTAETEEKNKTSDSPAAATTTNSIAKSLSPLPPPLPAPHTFLPNLNNENAQENSWEQHGSSLSNAQDSLLRQPFKQFQNTLTPLLKDKNPNNLKPQSVELLVSKAHVEQANDVPIANI